MDYTRLEEDYPDYLKSVKNDNPPIWQEMRKKINDFKPDIVGITVWTTFAASAFKVASLCKEYDEDLPVIMGGPHISIKYDEVIKICSHVDFLVRGEGEETILELVNVLQEYVNTKKKDNLSNDLSRIKGLSYRDNNQIVHNPSRPFIKDLNSIPYPARELLWNKNTYNSEDMGLLMTSRGCPYNCFYCATSIWERKTRYRSINNVINEIKLVMDNYDTQQFTLKDDSFTVNRQRVIEFCDKLKEENLDISWDCNTRVDLIDEKLLKTMKLAGCNSIKVGIETGSDRLLKLINKKTTLTQARKAAKLIRKAGIHWTGYFMMGLPSETKQETYQTLKFMRELRPDFASLSVYEPFPGTRLFEIGIEKGLVQKERTLEDFYNICPKYYYVKDIKKRVDTMPNEEFEQLESQIKRAFHRYNMGLGKLAKRAMSRSKVYLHEPAIFFGDIKRLWNWLR
jgi:radical SAM superfamily enzyme YgiQ (UPF0313 family)